MTSPPVTSPSLQRREWTAIVAVGATYLLAGLIFGALAGTAYSQGARAAWRLAAWVVSIVAFAAHIWVERAVWGRTSTRTALCAAAATALGAFGLAAAANVHAYVVSAHAHAVALRLSLLVWPVLTAVPAFVVAWVSATLIGRVRPSRGERAAV